MCDEIRDPSPQTIDLRAPIQNFGKLPEPALMALRDSLALQMRPDQLLACAAHYRKIRRDPSPTDLALLDAIALGAARQSYADAPLGTLTCTDATAADMIAALVADCRGTAAITPAITLRRALSLSARQVTSPGVGGLRTALLTDAEYAALPLFGYAAESSLHIGESGLRLLRALPAPTVRPLSPATADLIALMRLPDGASESILEDIQAFWPAQASRLRGVRICPQGNLIGTLTELTAFGCYVDLSPLAQSKQEAFETTVANAQGYLVRATKQDMPALVAAAQALGLTMIPFACATADGTLTVAEHDRPVAALPATLLRQLLLPAPREVELAPIPQADIAPAFAPLTLTRPTDWEAPKTYATGTPAVFGDLTVLHLSLPLTAGLSPAHLLRAVMGAVAHLTAAGGDFETLTLAVGLSAGSECAFCAAWAALPALYHLISKWKLAVLPPVMRAPRGQVGELSLCLMAKTVHPARVPSGSPAVRLFSAEPGANGLPSADELRALLSHASSLLTQGHIAGLRPLWATPLDGVLSELPDLLLRDDLTGTGWLPTRPQFGLLVFSDDEAKAGMLLGHIPDPITEALPAIAGLPAAYSWRHCPHPTVLMVAPAGTPDPTALLSLAKQCGARPSFSPLPLPLDHAACTALAETLADADIVLLKSESETAQALLSHHRVDHALQCLQARDGILMLVGGAADTCPAAVQEGLGMGIVRAPEGVDRDLLCRAIAYYR